MIVADSNILIYAAKGSWPALIRFLALEEPVFSAISYVETLGYHAIPAPEERLIEEFFRGARVVPVDDGVIRQAVRLRRMRKMALGDALIAVTALIHGGRLATRNIDDFRWIPDLEIINPM
jgi:predicted nucleic acid-binding protein